MMICPNVLANSFPFHFPQMSDVRYADMGPDVGTRLKSIRSSIDSSLVHSASAARVSCFFLIYFIACAIRNSHRETREENKQRLGSEE